MGIECPQYGVKKQPASTGWLERFFHAIQIRILIFEGAWDLAMYNFYNART